MTKPKTIKIDDTEYVRAADVEVPEVAGDLRIVILQRGWVMVGRLERNGEDCKLHAAAVVRKWGTTNGLPELASNGPLPNTVLDHCTGTVEFHWLTVIATIACDESKWSA